MSVYFTTNQEKLMKRVRFIQEEVAACNFHPEPCPLLDSQINEARVLVSRLSEALRLLESELKP